MSATRSGLIYNASRTMSEEEAGSSETPIVELLMEQHKMMLEQQKAQQDMMRELLEQQRAERAAEREQHRAEMARCREELQDMMAQAKREEEEKAEAKTRLPKPTLQKLNAGDDVEHFLETFERIAKQQSWPEEVWSTQLAG